MQPQRVLVIHAGGGKTGSSALQSALAEMSAQLAANGLAYINAPPTQSHYEITSGNGTALYDLIATARWDREGAGLVESYFGLHAIAICSSEFLGSMSAHSWQKLLKTTADLEIGVRIVFFVRPAGSYLASCYNQDVKRGGVHVTLDEYLVEATWHHLDALTTLEAVIPASALRVLNYEACRSDLAGAFAASFPELTAVAEILRSATRRKVNRSLDPAEIAVVRQVNRQLGNRAGEALSDRLIYASPEKFGVLCLDKAQADIIATKYADGTSWINSRFFAGSADFLPLEAKVDVSPAIDVEADNQVLAVALDWALEQCTGQSANDAEAIHRALLRIDWQNAGLPDIPLDFDPIAYLILNDDIVRAEVPPFLHYQSSGRSENRAYKWPQPSDARHDADIGNAAVSLRNEAADGSAHDSVQPLRYHYQLEGLLHAFAVRERDYLDEIRRLVERGAFNRAETKVMMGDVAATIVDTLSTNAESAKQDILSSVNRLTDKTDEDLRRLAEESARDIQSASREAVNEIRKLAEHAAFSRSETKVMMGDVAAAIVDTLSTNAESAKQDILSSVNRLTDKTDEDLRRLAEESARGIQSASREVVDEIRNALQDVADRQSRTQAISDDLIREAGDIQSRALADMSRERDAANLALLDRLGSLQNELARYNEALAEKDAELASQRAIVSRYREASSMGFLRWSIRRKQRP